jgi:hypothetical protein
MKKPAHERVMAGFLEAYCSGVETMTIFSERQHTHAILISARNPKPLAHALLSRHQHLDTGKARATPKKSPPGSGGLSIPRQTP